MPDTYVVAFYVIAVLFGAAAAILTWLTVKRENQPAVLSYLKRAFPRFMVAFVAPRWSSSKNNQRD